MAGYKYCELYYNMVFMLRKCGTNHRLVKIAVCVIVAPSDCSTYCVVCRISSLYRHLSKQVVIPSSSYLYE